MKKNTKSVFLLSLMLICLTVSLFSDADISGESKYKTERLQEIANQAYTMYKDITDGKNADYIPELAKVPSDLFGIVIVTVDGDVISVGDTDYSFAIESVSKPFTAALVLQETAQADILLEKIGVEPTGQPFNSVIAIETIPQRSVNPLVNAGAIAAVSLIPAKSQEERFEKIIGFYEKMAASDLTVLDAIYKSEAETNSHNKAIAYLLDSYERLYADPLEVTDVYTKQCSIGITTRQLGIMGATLANNGINPLSEEMVINPEYVSKILPIMMMCGFYNESGLWAYTVGLPSKTGVGGGIVSVVPGKMAITAFSPRLDQAGNSIKAMKAIEYISNQLKLSLFRQ
ncbi:MAG TPA: glutaminase A [Thermotogota bacterium]|nr:glutaminase A [Thermotogota bacterium]HPJ88196.1 glutaminase A [Thermotogota bacterium]HPR95629.1 glutaminase A [Thermotogota bacterium]